MDRNISVAEIMSNPINPSWEEILASYIWEEVSIFCDIQINDNGQQILTVHLRDVEIDIFGYSFANYCMQLKTYIYLQQQEVIVKFDKSKKSRGFGNTFILQHCYSETEKVFLFYFKDAIEDFSTRDSYAAANRYWYLIYENISNEWF